MASFALVRDALIAPTRSFCCALQPQERAVASNMAHITRTQRSGGSTSRICADSGVRYASFNYKTGVAIPVETRFWCEVGAEVAMGIMVNQNTFSG